MRREVIDCDRCPSKEIVAVTVSLAVGRSPDPAGGPSGEDFREFDLCDKCAAWAFGVVAKDLAYEAAEACAAKIATKIVRK